MRNVFETTAGKKQLCLLPPRWCFYFLQIFVPLKQMLQNFLSSQTHSQPEKKKVGLETNDTHCWIKLSHKCCLFILESRTITLLRSDTRMLGMTPQLFTPNIGLHFEKANEYCFFPPFFIFGKIYSIPSSFDDTNAFKKSITLSKSSFQSGCHKSPVLCPGSSYREFYCRPWCCHWIDWGWCGAAVEFSSP